ncbi:hypothetical protein ACIQAC_36560 [Streptomyces sp. NPDC088387]|uniref:hypothetical protein n=1 Tax=Streptomyces sp. NPDC088387 TaxID=3365859 RepID=UPI00382B7CA4
MRNGTATESSRPLGAKMTIEVFTVSRDGVVSAPRATVAVPYGYEPFLPGMGTQLPPCACPIHRRTGAAQ